MAVNLFSDTQTVPTPAMLRAMIEAEVGDEQRGTDPMPAIALEERVAALLGHEAAVFLPSGTMCNAIAVRLHVRPGGDEIILHAFAHAAESECGSPAALSGASLRFLQTPTGIYGPDAVEAAIRPGSRYTPRSRLLIVEQTTNLGGGRVWPAETIDAVVATARAHGLRVHLDGARLMNAVVAALVPAARFATGFDTAWLDFAKGLGCPFGAVLAGSRELIEEAWRYKQMWAARCASLDTWQPRASTPSITMSTGSPKTTPTQNCWPAVSPRSRASRSTPNDVETNIVIFGVEDAPRVSAALAAQGLEASSGGRTPPEGRHLPRCDAGGHRAGARAGSAAAVGST